METVTETKRHRHVIHAKVEKPVPARCKELTEQQEKEAFIYTSKVNAGKIFEKYL